MPSVIEAYISAFFEIVFHAALHACLLVQLCRVLQQAAAPLSCTPRTSRGVSKRSCFEVGMGRPEATGITTTVQDNDRHVESAELVCDKASAALTAALVEPPRLGSSFACHISSKPQACHNRCCTVPVQHPATQNEFRGVFDCSLTFPKIGSVPSRILGRK